MKFSQRRLLFALLTVLGLLLITSCVLMHSAPGIPVLNYHQVEEKNGNPLTLWPDQFEAQMAYLADEGYTTMTIDEMMDALENGTPLPEKPVIITFDDGYADNYEYAYPILKKYGFKATIFLIYDFTNTYPNYLTWEQINEMKESGLIHFESHTMTHANLAELTSYDDLHHEIADSHDLLSEKLGYDMHYIAYPGGRVNEEIEEITRAAGYRGGFTVHYGLSTPEEGRYQMDRIPIFGANMHTLTRFKMRLAFAPLIAPLEDLRLKLRSLGLTGLSNCMLIP
ncbi:MULTISPECIES: polysaccharide deacetylase family protein [Selenomonas]|uniref:Polysaccharide deacetylase family protein n=1 Tax=Selenomonas timonae TaxID=2754044 RepID=A0A7G7VHA8_9FIRM|nr:MULTISPECIES: polysaccharide deacetylase family protein [Selenomonas]EKX96575.1 polysaccharide deacetylase [Selenomonas sp. oral taxon 138 str. F0429]QNH53501.1 polysaccharide deacetylase family protein [Selenomonas timonae]